MKLRCTEERKGIKRKMALQAVCHANFSMACLLFNMLFSCQISLDTGKHGEEDREWYRRSHCVVSHHHPTSKKDPLRAALLIPTAEREGTKKGLCDLMKHHATGSLNPQIADLFHLSMLSLRTQDFPFPNMCFYSTLRSKKPKVTLDWKTCPCHCDIYKIL